MTRVFAVVWRDLKRAAGAPTGIALMLSVPLLLTGIIGLSFGSGRGNERIPRLKLLVLDRDKSFTSRLIGSVLGQERVAEYVEVSFVGEEGVDLIRRGKASALLVIPPGFGDSVLTQGTTALELVKNPAERYLPVVAEHGVRFLATGLDAVALLLEDQLAAIGAPRTISETAGAEQAAAIASGISRTLYRLGSRLSPWPILVERIGGSEGSRSIDLFGVFLPGFTVLMLMMIGQKLLREVTEERENGILAALVASPLHPVEYAAGKTCALLLIIGAGFAVLLPAGSLLFGITWGNPLGVVMVAASFAVATAGVMMLLAVLTRTARQAEALGIMVVLAMGLLGGSMLPFRAGDGLLAILSRMTPNRWAIEAFMKIMEGKPPAAVIREVTVLLAAGIAFVVVGAGALQREVTR